MTKPAGSALALLLLWLAGSPAVAQTRAWPTDPPPAQQQTAPWPSTPPAQPQQQAAPWPNNAPPQQQGAPWPGNAPPRQPAAMSAPPPMMGSGPPPGAGPGQPPPCIAQFMGHREKVEKAAATAKAASERKATREEMCKHITAYFNAEAQWIKFTKDNGAKCGIPAEVAKQLQTVHVRTGNTRKQICAAGPAAGPAAPSLSDALGTTTLPAPETTKTGRGTLDTLTGNALQR